MAIGPTEVLTTKKVCTGCDFLKKEPLFRGRKRKTDNYTCLHENTPKKENNIGFDLEEPVTPWFCPFNDV